MHSDLPDDSPLTLESSSESLGEFASESAPPLAQLIDVSPAGVARVAPLAYHAGVTVTRHGTSAARQLGASLRHLATELPNRLEKAISAPRPVQHQESDDFTVVAVLLAVVAIGYGALLTMSWRKPIELRVASVPVLSGVPSTPPAPIVQARPTASMVEVEPVVARRGSGALTARSLTAMWRQRDTRSLEQAFSSLRSQTLALHRCGMRMTGHDQAVARCEGAGRSTYTIDFRRSAGRWLITNVKTR